MYGYEIRLVKPGAEPRIHKTALMGDHAAIRRAQNLVGEGEVIEVWRGVTCVFDTWPPTALAS